MGLRAPLWSFARRWGPFPREEKWGSRQEPAAHGGESSCLMAALKGYGAWVELTGCLHGSPFPSLIRNCPFFFENLIPL